MRISTPGICLRFELSTSTCNSPSGRLGSQTDSCPVNLKGAPAVGMNVRVGRGVAAMEVVCVSIAGGVSGGISVGWAGISEIDAGNFEVAGLIVTTTMAVLIASGVLSAL